MTFACSQASWPRLCQLLLRQSVSCVLCASEGSSNACSSCNTGDAVCLAQHFALYLWLGVGEKKAAKHCHHYPGILELQRGITKEEGEKDTGAGKWWRPKQRCVFPISKVVTLIPKICINRSIWEQTTWCRVFQMHVSWWGTAKLSNAVSSKALYSCREFDTLCELKSCIFLSRKAHCWCTVRIGDRCLTAKCLI